MRPRCERDALTSLPSEAQIAWLEERAAQSRPGEAEAILGKTGRPGPVRAGDELPDA